MLEFSVSPEVLLKIETYHFANILKVFQSILFLSIVTGCIKSSNKQNSIQNILDAESGNNTHLAIREIPSLENKDNLRKEKSMPPPWLQRERKKKIVKLENGIEALLIFDSKSAKSSISVDVGVGCLSNPPEHKGLAHFIEHLLFLGTQKYPNPSEFSKFIEVSGGSTNATTTDTNTNYQVEINTSSFSEAIERFSRFFIDPTFDENQISSELKNLDQEYLKNKKSIVWKLEHFKTHFAPNGHSIKNTFQGDSESLKNLKRKDVVDFYKKNYGSQNLKIAVISPLPIEEQERLIRDHFSQVLKSNAVPPIHDTNVVAKEKLPVLVELNTSDPVDYLFLRFSVRSDAKEWNSNPLGVIRNYLDYDGPKSLPAYLKNEGLVSKFETSVETKIHTSTFEIFCQLTELGFRKYEEIVKLIFSQIKRIENDGLTISHFKEISKISAYRYDFHTPESGLDGAAHYAANMHLYDGAENLDAKIYRIDYYNPALFQGFIKELNPDNLQVYLGSRKIKGSRNLPFYDINFNEIALKNSEFIKSIRNVPPSLLEFAPVNTFVPNAQIVSKTTDEKLVKIKETPQVSIWHSKGSFSDPRTGLHLIVGKNYVDHDPKFEVLSEIYSHAMANKINEETALARNTDYIAKFNIENRSLSLTLSGYGQNFKKFFNLVLKTISKFSISEKEFLVHRENAKKDTAISLEALDSYSRAWTLLKNSRNFGELDESEYEQIYDQLTFEDMKNWEKQIQYRGPVKFFTYGDISETHVLDYFEETAQALRISTNGESKNFLSATIEIPEGKKYAFWKPTAGINNAWASAFFIGDRTLQNQALTYLASTILSSSFHEDLRTQKTLGYIVQATNLSTISSAWIGFLIQSDKSLELLSETANTYLKNFFRTIENMDENEFNRIKENQVESILKKPESQDAEFAKHLDTIIYNDGDVDFSKKLADAIKAISKTEFVEFLKKLFDDKLKRQVSTYVYSNNHHPKELNSEINLTGLKEFQKSLKKMEK